MRSCALCALVSAAPEVHMLMLLAKIKGTKVHFGKLVTFLGGGGVCLRPTDPLDPLEGVLGGHLLENFPRGGVSPNFKSQGGGQTP